MHLAIPEEDISGRKGALLAFKTTRILDIIVNNGSAFSTKDLSMLRPRQAARHRHREDQRNIVCVSDLPGGGRGPCRVT